MPVPCRRVSRLSEDLTVVREMAAAERGGEAADILRIRAKGDEARKQTQAVSGFLVV